MVSNLRRLAADHAALHSKLPPYYVLPPDDGNFAAADDLSQLNILLTGPPGTPYSEGLWRLCLKMPQDYPNSPPKATFRTRIWHPNVEELTGAVCVDTLKRDWKSTLTLRDVLITISCLLIHPNPDSALNSTAGNLLREEYDVFAHQAKLMTSIHAPIQSDLRALVNEAKSRGEDSSSAPRKPDPHYQRPRKQQRTQSSASRNTGLQPSHSEYVLPPRDIPHPQPILEDDQMQISDTDDENDDPVSASKENNPSFSPAPMRMAPSIGIRKNAFGKRPLSVLSMVYPEDPDTEMMIVDTESDNEKGSEASNTASFSSSDQNIAANIPSSSTNFSRHIPKSPPITPYRKTPRLAPSRRANTPTRLREDVQIYEDVPDRTLTDISRRFGRDEKENCDAVTGSYGVKGLRGLHAEKVAQSGSHIVIQPGTAYSTTQSLMSSSTSPLKASKKMVGGSRRTMTKTKPRIGSRPGFDPHARSEPTTTQRSSFFQASPSVTRQQRTPFQTETHLEDDDSDIFPDDDLGHIIAAIDVKNHGTVGCSFYSAEKETLYLLGDSPSGGAETVEALITQIKPTVILTPPRVDILSIRGQKQSLAHESDSSSYLPYQIDVCPTQDFSIFSAQSRLVALDVSSSHEDRVRFFVPHNGLTGSEEVNPEEMGFTLHEGRLLHISSSVDMENPVTMGCIGAVLTYLQKRRATSTGLEHPDSCGFRVRALEMFSLKDTMWISSNALISLQIIQSESHPNMFNQGPGKKSSSGKEGLSLFGLFRRFAYTPQGRALLKQVFFRPSVNLDVIRERHDFIGAFSRPDNMATVEKMAKALKHIKNLRPTMINLHKGINTGSGKTTGFKATVWESLLAFAFHTMDLRVSLQEIAGAERLELPAKALRVFEAAPLLRLGQMIQEIVDIDGSDEQGRAVVKQGLDRDLDRMKDCYDGLGSLLKHVALEITANIPRDVQVDLNIIYFPQLGFNIAIGLNDKGEPGYSGTREDWELVFITETRAYFKDFRMRELDEKLGDIYGSICEKEIEIIYDLAQRVLQYETVLVEASDVCGEIDCYLALTQTASFYHLTRPRMTSENLIQIKGGRHLLQELTVSSYVPNDTLLMGGTQSLETTSSINEAPSMLLLTGPNYSGKSVYMKQVALIVYLAQIGSFVPAESAALGITDKILTKINTQESVSKIQSTFMNDLQQISLCLKQVTGRSLVLIDEFGKGTNESDGIGLACGIFENLLNLEEPPKVLGATHFHEIFENNFLPLRPRLQLGHMEVKVCEETPEIEDQVTYLYNFRKGRSNKSFGTICAAINGIDASIVSRANEIASLAARGENLIAACAAITDEEMQALQHAESMARKFLEVDLTGTEAPQRDAKTILEDLFESTD